MTQPTLLLALADPNVASLMEQSVLRPAGYEVTQAIEPPTIEMLVRNSPPNLILLGEKLKEVSGMELARDLLKINPSLPIIMMASQFSEGLLQQALQAGIMECLAPPVRPMDVLDAIERSLHRRKAIEEWVLLQTRRNTNSLRRRLDTLETLQRLGQSMTASLNLDNVLTTIVDAAVDLSGAEEGSLLLLDENTGELYMRAARNFQDEFVRTFRLPIRDSLPGQVLRTGQPITIDEKTPQKISTAYLVHSLIYVPMQVHGRVVGVLGIDNRQSGFPFKDDHLTLMTSLADYAAIAIENARLYSRTELERNKLEMILTKIQDGVIVINPDGRLILVNHTARAAFALKDSDLFGRPVKDVFQHPDLLELIEDNRSHPSRSEITLDDGRVFSAQTTPIPDIGLAITMQDITYLKELDRIKTDFVNTVSHDLRSPLTAILGYVELIGKAGAINEQQREFIHRVQFSVNNITALINDLLDLGRIEAGFDARKEIIHLPEIIQHAIEGLRKRITDSEQEVILDIAEDLPTLLGNPIRLRQMLTNLIHNAVKYTPPNGKITIRALAEDGQIILQIVDTGLGIPPADQPYIFDKFYRGSNVPYDAPGSGLGLAIVKSIVQNHQGRIWLDSSLGQGTTFTVVLPIADES